jgi:predicted nucleic acid-binding protein
MMVYLDTNCVIYLVEQDPVWWPKVVHRLAAVRQAGDGIATSDLTRTKCLAHPFSKGDAAQVADYQTFFSGSGAQVQMLALTAGVCERAAQLRAASGFRLKVPDCLHLAAAIEHGCGLFLTNDTDLSTCPQIPVEILT